MPETPLTLLERLRGRPDAGDWDRFLDIYAPLLRRWLANIPGLGGEAGDVGQDVLAAVVWKLPAFERRRDGAFRAWRSVVVANRVLPAGVEPEVRCEIFRAVCALANDFHNIGGGYIVGIGCVDGQVVTFRPVGIDVV